MGNVSENELDLWRKLKKKNAVLLMWSVTTWSTLEAQECQENDWEEGRKGGGALGQKK